MSSDEIPTNPEPAASVDVTAERERQINDIVTDTAMSVGERQARLEALAAEWGLSPDGDGDMVDDPFLLQISSALAMLSEGGHR